MVGMLFNIRTQQQLPKSRYGYSPWSYGWSRLRNSKLNSTKDEKGKFHSINIGTSNILFKCACLTSTNPNFDWETRKSSRFKVNSIWDRCYLFAHVKGRDLILFNVFQKKAVQNRNVKHLLIQVRPIHRLLYNDLNHCAMGLTWVVDWMNEQRMKPII